MNTKFKYFLPILLLISAVCTAQDEKGTIRLEVWGDTVSWIYTPNNSELINTTSMVIDYKNVDIDRGVMYECDSKPYGEIAWSREKLERGRYRLYIYITERLRKWSFRRYRGYLKLSKPGRQTAEGE